MFDARFPFVVTVLFGVGWDGVATGVGAEVETEFETGVEMGVVTGVGTGVEMGVGAEVGTLAGTGVGAILISSCLKAGEIILTATSLGATGVDADNFGFST